MKGIPVTGTPKKKALPIAEAQKAYCSLWGKSAREIEDQGIYDWAANDALQFVGADQTILEIGCGVGLSTLKIVNILKPSKLIGIDSNHDCAKTTHRLLSTSGIASKHVERIKHKDTHDGYTSKAQGRIKTGMYANIIEAEILQLDDTELFEALKNAHPLVLLLWFCGGGAAQNRRSPREFPLIPFEKGGSYEANYRHTIQARCFYIANLLTVPKVHIVDRFGVTDGGIDPTQEELDEDTERVTRLSQGMYGLKRVNVTEYSQNKGVKLTNHEMAQVQAVRSICAERKHL